MRREALPLPTYILARHRRQQRAKRRRVWLLRGIELGLLCSVFAWAVLGLAVQATPFPKAWFARSTLSLVLQDRDGRFLHEEPAPNGRFGAWLPDNKIPRSLRLMTMAAEDHRLHEHQGVDLYAVARALWSNIKSIRRVSGASTLAMQLVRQLQPAPRTYPNKIREMFWAMVLQKHLKAEGILREYLNRAPYGNRVQGAHRAALLYFDLPAADLSIAQAAFLAGLPWAPGRLNPFHPRGRSRAMARAHRILKRARQLGWISAREYHEATHDPIRVQNKPQRSLLSIHFTERILRGWKRRKAHKPTRQLTTLRTTLDLQLQRKATASLRFHLKRLKPYGAGTGAVIVIDHRSGEILTYVASHHYFDKENRGSIDYLSTPRSPGSTLKPFIYGQAIEHAGFHGATILSDLARSFIWRHGSYHPRNYDFRFLGPMRMRVALGNSRNIPALRTLARVGVTNMLDKLRALGLHSLKQDPDFYGLGLALGAGEVKLLELARAYTTLARSGRPVRLRWAYQAHDSLGRRRPTSALLPQLFSRGAPHKQLISPSAANILAHILADPIARLPSFGRYSSLEFPFPVAVKTGTSQGYRDTWMLGFSDRVVVGCWVGNHDRRRMHRLSGASGCGRIFSTVMHAAMQRVDPHQPPQDFPPPPRWKKVLVCPLSGLRATPSCEGSVEEWLPTHTHTPRSCHFHRAITLDKRNGLRAGPQCPTQYTHKRTFIVPPPEYATWARVMSYQPPPQRYSPLCPKEGAPTAPKAHLAIRNPAHRARFLLDPTIPPEYATLALQINTSRPVDQIVWFIDGKEIGRRGWPHTLRWPLKRGTHRVSAATPDGRAQAQPITITIR